MSTVTMIHHAATIANTALNEVGEEHLNRISKAALLAEEYAHFRSCGISRALTLNHLAGVYRTTPGYAARICKETF